MRPWFWPLDAPARAASADYNLLEDPDLIARVRALNALPGPSTANVTELRLIASWEALRHECRELDQPLVSETLK